jgi:hypothetical protein
MGAADLIANGKQVAVIDYHTGDTYENSYATSRLSYYGLTGTPTAWFDGGSAVVGGSHTVSMYPQYLAKYNQRINVLSSFTIDIEGTNNGMIDYELNITLNKVATTTATNMVMHLLVTESHIQQSWQGMSELNHVERIMIPNQSGTPLDFTATNTIQLTKTFTMNPDWVNENCEIIVFIQNLQNKEVLQATVRNLTDIVTNNTHDASIVKVVAPQTVCQENFTPKIKIKNFGLDNLTSLEIVSQINNEPIVTTNWTGNLAFLESEIFILPEINFTILSTNTFTVSCQNPNGQADQYPSNNSMMIPITDAANVTSPVSLALKLDENPGETSWTLQNSAGTVLYSGGPYTQANQFIIQNFVLPDPDCYSFVIYDSGGDGIVGAGMYKLAYNGSTIFAEGKDFGFEDQVQFGIGLTDVTEVTAEIGLLISPNPVKDNAVVTFELTKSNPVQLKVFNSTGKMVYASTEQIFSAGNHSILFESKNLNPGIYYFHLNLGDQVLTKKVVIID